MQGRSSRVLFTAQGMVFAGNDAIGMRSVSLGLDGVSLITPFPRASGQFVRVQAALEPGVWLDADGVIEDCVRAGGEWRWEVLFARLDEPQKLNLDRFIRREQAAQQAPTATGPSAPPARPDPAPPKQSGAPPEPRPTREASVPPVVPGSAPPKQTGVRVREIAAPIGGKRALNDLFKEALDEVGGRRKR